MLALLSPGDVAHHPNFPKEGDDTDHERLADLLLSRPSRPGQTDEPTDANKQTYPISQAFYRASTFGTEREGAVELVRLAKELSAIDSTAMVTCALLSTVVFCDLDEVEAALDVIDMALGGLTEHPTVPPAEESLLTGLLKIQKAFRLSDIGRWRESYPLLDEALVSFSENPVDAIGTVELAAGATVTSSTLLVESVREAAVRCVEGIKGSTPDTNGDLVIQFTPREPELLRRREYRLRASGLQQILDGSFETTISPTADIARRSSDQLWCAQMSSELMPTGSSTRRGRLELGMARFLDASFHNDVWVQECLRLVRQSGDPKVTKQLFGHVRELGPLDAVLMDGDRILQRAKQGVLRRADLIAIGVVANLWSGEQCNCIIVALRLMWRELRPYGSMVQNDPGVRDVVIALAGLAENASTDVAGLMLEIIREHPVSSLDDEYSRAAGAIRWREVDVAAVAAWKNWISEGHSELPELTATAMQKLRVGSSKSPAPFAKGTVAWSAHFLNMAVTGTDWPFPRDDIASTQVALNDALSSISLRAAEGDDAYGGYQAADVLAALVTNVEGFEASWEVLASFLADPNVQRHHTADTFERLTRWDGQVPSSVLDKFRQSREDILRPRPLSWLDKQGSDLPVNTEAFRLFVKYQLIETGAVFSVILQLVGHSARGKVEAVRAMQLLIEHESPLWIIALAAQLSLDDVRAVAGSAAELMGLLYRNDPLNDGVVAERVRDLLDADGVLVPFMTLRGLGGPHAADALAQDIVSRVRRMSRSHPDRIIREAAERVVAPIGRTSPHMPSSTAT